MKKTYLSDESSTAKIYIVVVWTLIILFCIVFFFLVTEDSGMYEKINFYSKTNKNAITV